MGGSMMRNYILTFDKTNKQMGFNGQPLSSWKYLFVIFQLVLSTLILIGVGIAVYLILTVRYVKIEKLKKSKAKKTK